MRSNYAVRSAVPGTVEFSVLIRALDALINQGPEEAAATHFAFADQLPVVPHSFSDSSVVKPVEKLSGQVNIRTNGEFCVTVEFLVMIGIGKAKLLPGV